MKSVRFHELQTVLMLNNGIAERFENSKCDMENRWYSLSDLKMNLDLYQRNCNCSEKIDY
jgi:hypothetical protein